MSEPVPPIFVFESDLGVFASVADAEQQYEPWIIDIVSAAYDAQGSVLRLEVGGRTGVRVTTSAPPVKEYDAFVARLRDRLVGDAESPSYLLDEQWARNASGEELIEWCAANRMHPPTNQPLQWTGAAGIFSFVRKLLGRGPGH